jgi:CDP-glucose 4,6-dehydratase
VLDCLAGYLSFAEKMDQPISRALNFGPDPSDCVSVAALTRTMLEALGAAPEFDVAPAAGPREMRTLAIDARRAGRELGWRNRLPGEHAIRWTADWHRRARLGEDPRVVTLSQIDAYASLSGNAS